MNCIIRDRNPGMSREIQNGRHVNTTFMLLLLLLEQMCVSCQVQTNSTHVCRLCGGEMFAQIELVRLCVFRSPETRHLSDLS